MIEEVKVPKKEIEPEYIDMPEGALRLVDLPDSEEFKLINEILEGSKA